MTKVLFTEISGNKKTGPIAVSYSQNNTCPDACQLKGNGCYAEGGRVAISWRRLSANQEGKSHYSWDDFLLRVKAIKRNSLFRMNVAGDLPGENNMINREMLDNLNTACYRIKGFTYTHKPVGWGDVGEHPMTMAVRASNTEAVKESNRKAKETGNGLTINLSADSIKQADYLSSLNIGPVVCVVPMDAPRHMKTPEGRHIIVCPNEEDKTITCDKCELCAKPKRKAIIGFRAHGFRRHKVSKRLEAENSARIHLDVVQ